MFTNEGETVVQNEEDIPRGCIAIAATSAWSIRVRSRHEKVEDRCIESCQGVGKLQYTRQFFPQHVYVKGSHKCKKI